MSLLYLFVAMILIVWAGHIACPEEIQCCGQQNCPQRNLCNERYSVLNKKH